MAENCSACANLKEYAPNFVANGITDKECQSLQKDTGLNPNLSVLHNNCEDLNDMLACLLGVPKDKLPAFDVCDWKEFMEIYMTNMETFQKAMVCNACGQWAMIWELLKRIEALEKIIIDREGYVTVTKTYSHTVPVDKFITTGGGNEIYWSGSPNMGESYINIPVSEMDIVDTVVAQPQVVGNRVHAVTVAIQSSVKIGDNYQVNFDTYEIEGIIDSQYPYSVPVTFIVVGRKKVK
ncbi:hypothetical protein [Enterococcus sp. CWB-B31]|uniref:hypothetical protein n=1 Tax=Enterococcus sp. CWB-B31 TaxID=2885159 RepID=UPI001E2E99C5|nr:hypothetical protein [Enterococcus sp. CWB-B31]MCB5954011.1 hypothetical protein [Enterococcus sp. CWB-B31]